jgi:hypothetical protein
MTAHSPMHRPTLWVAVRTLLWLRWREVGGTRPKTVVAAAVMWFVASGAAGFVAGRASGWQIAASLSVASAFAWMIAPAIGAGSSEIAAPERLVAFPVDRQALRWATWLSSSGDLPVFISVGGLIGAAGGAAGMPGVCAALALIVAGTGLGQLAAGWTGRLVERFGWYATVLPTSVVVAGAVVTARTGSISTVADWMPGGWAGHAYEAAALGDTATAWAWCAALVAAAVVAAAGVSRMPLSRPHGVRRAGDLSPQPLPRRLLAFAVMLRCIGRAPTARLVLVGAVVAPVVLSFAASAAGRPASDTSAAQAVLLAVGLTLGVNTFSYVGPGMSLLVSAPERAQTWVRAAAGAVAVIAFAVTAAATTLAGAVGLGERVSAGGLAMTAVIAAMVGALGAWWSLRHPAAADHDSLRCRPAPLRSSALFAGVLGFAVMGVGSLGEVSLTAGVVSGAVVTAFALWRGGSLAPRRFPAVAAAVRG